MPRISDNGVEVLEEEKIELTSETEAAVSEPESTVPVTKSAETPDISEDSETAESGQEIEESADSADSEEPVEETETSGEPAEESEDSGEDIAPDTESEEPKSNIKVIYRVLLILAVILFTLGILYLHLYSHVHPR